MKCDFSAFCDDPVDLGIVCGHSVSLVCPLWFVGLHDLLGMTYVNPKLVDLLSFFPSFLILLIILTFFCLVISFHP